VTELSRYVFEVLRKDQEFILYRGRSKGDASQVLVLSPVAEYPAPGRLKRLEHEYSLREELDPAWAARPTAIARHWDRPVLVLDDPGGMPLDELLAASNDSSFAQAGSQPLERSQALVSRGDIAFPMRVAISLSTAIGHLHQRGLIHKDIKPANVLVNSATGQCWLMGFGIASRLRRESQDPVPPESIAGTLAYMAPEQTGRMNRSIDSRSDLYSFGVTLYEMLTGSVPFMASDPMEWVHCHIARQSTPPKERSTDIPASVSAIIMKLLAKTAEERYQTAAGAEWDLRRCLAQWETQRRIDEFPLGEHDRPDRLLIPEKLYGRSREIKTLLDAFDQAVTTGQPNLVLISGYSGIGKSSVVNELQKVLVPPRGLFASGKFDQHKRDVPYATLAQAFDGLIRPLLSKSETSLEIWRDALGEAFGPNGMLMVDLVPALRLIIGEQSPVPDLPPRDAQRRFRLVFRRFIGVFARPEHPLVLFLDDLQWLDAATLDLLEDLLTQPDVRHLMLIGAYRDNEVDSAHPLLRKLEVIRQSGAIVREITLLPLTCEDFGRLIADSLHCERESITSLAQLVHEKTAGNPFFAIQFVYALAEEALLTFDHGDRRWAWDLRRINAKGYTDNVADLLLRKLNRLPIGTQKALQELACLGNSAEIATLSIVHGESEDEVHLDLWEAVRLEFIVRLERSYKFVHDRVQEAAYSLIPEQSRAATHLLIGRLLWTHIAPEKREEVVFEIVGQLNRGATLISSRDEREQLAELNLMAGKRAKISTAYASALGYLVAGCALLAEDSWEQGYPLTFALQFQRAECEFLTGDIAAAEERLSMLSGRVRNLIDRAAVTRLRAELYTTLDQIDRAVEVGLEYLRHAGVEWSPHPTKEDVEREYTKVWQQLGARTVEQLVDLPLMTDPDCRATLDVLSVFATPAWHADENLHDLVGAHMANLSLEHGNSDGSCHAYALLGRILGSNLGQYRAGFQFGKLAVDLIEKRGLHRFKARVYNAFGHHITPWARHLRDGRVWNGRAFSAAKESGDFTYAAFSSSNMIANLLAGGDPLEGVQQEAEEGLELTRKIRFDLVSDYIITALRLIRTLRGQTPEFGSFNDAEFDEGRFERHLEENPRLASAACRYWIRKLQARFYAEDYTSAIGAAAKAHLLHRRQSFFEVAEYPFYSALAHAALCDSASAEARAWHLGTVATHLQQLATWKENCPENFGSCAALVGAEMARIEGRELHAERLYEEAIHLAGEHGFVQNEAIAHEVAARFYAGRGLKTIARAYLRNARYLYMRWGALGKVKHLELRYPGLREPADGAVVPFLEQVDALALAKASQAISSELDLGKLIETLLVIALENAGAQRGVLVLLRGDEPQIEAEAMTADHAVTVRFRRAFRMPAELPDSILRYVIRTHENIILDDGSAPNLFSADPYLQKGQARSVLCLPLVKQGSLKGALYLENNLVPHVFTPDRIAVLKVLASQAAISLENTRLYRDLEEREAKIRRLFDANIVGIFIWNLEGEIIEANEAFLQLLGYGREDLTSGRLRLTNLTPAEARDREPKMTELKVAGIVQPYQKEFFRKDGNRVPVMIGAARFEGSGNEGVAFVLDLSGQKRADEERKRAEQKLWESEYNLRLFMETIPQMLWSAAPDGAIDYCNQRIADYIGLSGDELLGAGWLSAIHPNDRDALAKAWASAVSEGHPYQFEFRVQRAADGMYRWCMANAVPLRDQAGRISKWYGSVVDLHDWKQAQEDLRLREAELAHATRVMTMGEITGSIAHEINQPLGAIANNANAGQRLLAAGSENLPEVKRALSDIVKGVDVATSIIVRMRALVKKVPPEMGRLHLHELVTEVLSLIRHELTRRHVTIRSELPKDLPPVLGDRVQLQQVLLNLVMNGVEAMDEIGEGERRISIGARRHEHDGRPAVVVSVQDSGVGLKQAKVDKLFEAFYTTKAQGLGMGLAISRSIIEAHGGRLWAATASGPGATFEFTLPTKS
jgi:PAS domain S-box-containing protein